ncbi:RNA polymerase sigma-70 factor (ECF subfamily) [Salirhabdus euzebyi]|uniref:RNA polymerase sigma factor n=1 Tax=Salirhabdus euzebyi TaxID=394506 RepID=A0A841Q7X2_9BACI|nr:sigma-70 family RNA polymerase sigma factor [Salirhabdus euzebyi]MBB6454475.1 RNA polymerase sigma-70 factor (ECF subfamily) [Salirhabdus euzebyi]
MERSIDDLYKQYNKDLFKFLMYMGVNKEQAEDLVQDVFLRVLKAQDDCQKVNNEKTWLFTIARNIVIDHFRKQGKRKNYQYDYYYFENELRDYQPQPEELTIQKEELCWIYRCLDYCTVDQRKVIILRYLNELPIAEASKCLGWTESKVKTTQHRALKILKCYMEKEKAGESLIGANYMLPA